MLPATQQRWHSRPYPSRSWYSIKRPGGMQGSCVCIAVCVFPITLFVQMIGFTVRLVVLSWRRSDHQFNDVTYSLTGQKLLIKASWGVLICLSVSASVASVDVGDWNCTSFIRVRCRRGVWARWRVWRSVSRPTDSLQLRHHRFACTAVVQKARERERERERKKFIHHKANNQYYNQNELMWQAAREEIPI